MRVQIVVRFLMIMIGSALVGCGGATPAPGPTSTAKGPATKTEPPADGQRFVLDKEPTSAKGVIEVRKDAKNDEEVVIVGRIGGDVKPWVEGRASFLIVNPSLKPCNERPGDTCETPWDYCCDTDVLPKSMASVKFVDEKGGTVATDARKLLGIKELQTVVVKGKAKRDDAGNLVVLATGLFVRK